VSTLEVSYRSARPITDFALALLGDLRDDATPVTTTREGPPVESFEFTDEGACVAFLGEALTALASEEPRASIAVLTPSEEASEIYFRGLVESDVPGLHRVAHQDFRFGPGVEITEIDQAKGLEFDYVILVDTDAENYPADDASRRRLHVGATRAIHQLWLMMTETPSPLVREAVATVGPRRPLDAERKVQFPTPPEERRDD
jgi:DNA helicase-2/ATP-dependent DNA helicase PcrA